MEFEGDKNGHIYNQFLDIMKNFKAHEYVARYSLAVGPWCQVLLPRRAF